MITYIDMDGTLTEYNYEDYNTNKQVNWLTTPEILCKPPVIEYIPEDFIILTRVSTDKEALVKIQWALKYFPNNKIITTKEPKHTIVDPTNCILIDDYNKNLEEWKQAGGIPIKFINNINSIRNDMYCLDKVKLALVLSACDNTLRYSNKL